MLYVRDGCGVSMLGDIQLDIRVIFLIDGMYKVGMLYL